MATRNDDSGRGSGRDADSAYGRRKGRVTPRQLWARNQAAPEAGRERPEPGSPSGPCAGDGVPSTDDIKEETIVRAQRGGKKDETPGGNDWEAPEQADSGDPECEGQEGGSEGEPDEEAATTESAAGDEKEEDRPVGPGLAERSGSAETASGEEAAAEGEEDRAAAQGGAGRYKLVQGPQPGTMRLPHSTHGPAPEDAGKQARVEAEDRLSGTFVLGVLIIVAALILGFALIRLQRRVLSVESRVQVLEQSISNGGAPK
jgi:hypothetical protein